ncbi:MAG: protein kinase [Planctomycetota bacterium]|nr:protein kinase [Planctomycetota bacterium]
MTELTLVSRRGHAVESPSVPGVSPPPADIELISLVAQGELAEVWRAFDRSTGQDIAWKQIRADRGNLNQGADRLRAEAEVLSRVASPYVVRLMGTDFDRPLPALRLEWIEGETVAARLSRRVPVDLGEALWIARQGLQGMHALLRAGVVHSQLTANHLLIRSDGTVALVDLSRATFDQATGIVLDAERRETESETPNSHSTGFRVNRIERDLAGLAVVLAQLVTGSNESPPESAGTDSARSAGEIALWIRRRAPHVPRELVGWIDQLTTLEPLPRGEGLMRWIHQLVGMELRAMIER